MTEAVFMYHEITFFTGQKVHDFFLTTESHLSHCFCQYFVDMHVDVGVVIIVVSIVLAVSYDLAAVVGALAFVVEKVIVAFYVDDVHVLVV